MRVVSKHLVKYSEPIAVYDLTSPEHENFALASGAVVHNCKRARDKTFQAVYPMKGKPLNVIDTKKEKVNANAETMGLLASLGMDLNSKDPGKTIAYGKIIEMADPDVDGMHINCLMTATIWKFAPHIVHAGHLFAVRAPLYKTRHKGRVLFAMSKEKLYERCGTKKLDITYIKGWGEVDEADLSIALDPRQRTLYRITAPDAKAASEFLQLMGAKVDYRKKLLNVA